MSNTASSSLITGASTRKTGPRFLVHWRARLFMADKVIHPATVTAAYKSGFTIKFAHAIPMGTDMHIEFAVNFKDEKHRLRTKAKVGYCLLLSGGEAAELDLNILQISRQDNHTYNNVLQALQEAKEMNLQM